MNRGVQPPVVALFILAPTFKRAAMTAALPAVAGAKSGVTSSDASWLAEIVPQSTFAPAF
jgi:hypothetical protein